MKISKVSTPIKRISFLILVMISILFLFENPEVLAVSPTFNFEQFTLNDGGVQDSVGPTAPVIVKVVDPNAAGSGSIKVRITSTVDPDGFDLTLKEDSPGNFETAKLVLMSSTNTIPSEGTLTITVFDTLFTAPNPSEIQFLGGPPVVVVSESDKSGIFPQFIETGPDTNLYQTTINFGSSTDIDTNTLMVNPGDIVSIFDLSPFGNSANTVYLANTYTNGIHAEVGGTVTATYQGDSNLFTINEYPQPGRGSGGLRSPGLVVDSASSYGGGCGNCQPPTLGIDRKFNRIVSSGFSYNDNPIDVEEFYTPYPLIKVKVGKENTAVLKVFDDGGIDAISHVGLAFGLGHGESFSQSKAIISLDRTFDGKEILDIFDPEHTLDNVKITTSTDLCNRFSANECLVVNIQHTFREELEFNMVSTNVWDNKRNGWQNYYNHGIEVRGDSLNSPKTKMVAFGENEIRGLHELTQIDKINYLWKDSFGNIYEDKGNDRFDRIYANTVEVKRDGLTQHGCDRNCNWFDEYQQNQEVIAKDTLKKILLGKNINGNIPESFHYQLNPTTRAENQELQESIIYEQQRAEKVIENLR